MLSTLSKHSANFGARLAVGGVISCGLIVVGCLAFIGGKAAPVTEKLAAAEASTVSGSGANVAIDNFTFTPDTITVAPGTTVKWQNKDDVPHTVTGVNKTFDIGRPRYRPDVFASIHCGRQLRLFLRGSSAHDRSGHREINQLSTSSILPKEIPCFRQPVLSHRMMASIVEVFSSAWRGPARVCSGRSSGGVPTSRLLAAEAGGGNGGFSFVQISDSHIGFSKEVNKDVDRNAADGRWPDQREPDASMLLIHTGDLTHLSKAAEFDTVDQVLREAKVEQTFFVPGEHDVFTDDGKAYLDRYGKGTKGLGWSSTMCMAYIYRIGECRQPEAGRARAARATEQLDWLAKDVARSARSTPIVVYAHVPLWSVYPKWGWGTEDGAAGAVHAEAVRIVTVLNGHIHQILQKVEGNVTFHTARSTAFPQPAPGTAESPGPMKNVPANKLKSMLGLTRVEYVERTGELAIADATLE